jgi:hypothetical protein
VGAAAGAVPAGFVKLDELVEPGESLDPQAVSNATTARAASPIGRARRITSVLLECEHGSAPDPKRAAQGRRDGGTVEY